MKYFRLLCPFLLMISNLAMANINGSDFQSFNPASDNGDFVTVYSSKTLKPGTLNIGAFLDHATNTLPAPLDATNQKYGANNTILSSDLHMALGLSPRWQLGLNIGSTLDTQVRPETLRDYYKARGLTDVRVNTKVNFYRGDQWGWALNLLADFPQVENDYLYGNSKKPSSAAELITSVDINQWSWALNAGYNFRQKGDKIPGGPYEPVGEGWLGSLAGAYRMDEKWTFVGEIYGAIPKEGTPYYSQHTLSSSEGLLGAKYKCNSSLEWQAGATSAFSKGVSSPDYRLYAGLNWQVDDLWTRKPTPLPVAVSPPPIPAPVIDAPVEFPPMSNFIVSNMNFDSGSAKVSDRYSEYLKEFVAYVNAKKIYKQVTIQGHTDDVGTEAANQKLSEARAEAVRKILVENGLDQNKVHAKGQGETKPIATNATPEGRQKNRRIEFIVEE